MSAVTFTAAVLADNEDTMALYTNELELMSISALIYDASEDLTAYLATELSEADTEAATAYTDGYAIQFQTSIDNTLLNAGSGTDYFALGPACVTGESSTTVRVLGIPATDTWGATSCVLAEIEVYDASYAMTTTSLYAQVYEATDLDGFEGVVEESNVGMAGSWVCDAAIPTDEAVPDLHNWTVTCTRFLPTLATSAITDLRFDMDLDEAKLGYMDGAAGETEITYVTPGADTYTWAGASQVASLVGAAAIVALSF